MEFPLFLLPSFVLFVFGYVSISFSNLLYRNLLSPLLFSQRKNLRKFGNWVIVTGATDGIGRAFSLNLARHGFNLVLISRTEEKLRDFKQELSQFQVEVKTIKADFTKVDIYENIEREISGLKVAMLINNVGISYAFPNSLIDDNVVSNDFLINIINCNCLSATLMTKLVLKSGMVERGGFILNISSEFGSVPCPFLSVYGATKSFINQFSKNMASELKTSKVFVQNVEPLVVATKMSMMRESFTIPSAASYVESTLSRLGTCHSTHGCFIHELQAWIIGMIPYCIIERIVHSSLINMRARALRKMAKQQ